MYSKSSKELPNPDDQRFYSLLKVVNRPLWEGCVHSQLSLAVRMLSNKSEANQSQSSFYQWASLMSEISPQPKTIPKDFYQAKRLVSKLWLHEVKIDFCLNGCILYYKDDIALTYCKFYGKPRFKSKRGGSVMYKDVLHKRIHNLPLIPRLKRLYGSIEFSTLHEVAL